MIYLDNAATSWPKPPSVAEAVAACLTAGGNPGRSGHRKSIEAAGLVEEARELVARLLGAGDPARIAFAPNATHALNVALYGLLHPGDRVVTTTLEHNAVMRPLRHLEQQGVEVATVPCSAEGVDLDALEAAVRQGARLVVTTHASNVTGSVLPIAAIGTIARRHGVAYLVDAAQTAGVVPIDVDTDAIDLLAFTGHKGLLGPTGTGGLYVREGIALPPLVRGGTGSDSAREVQPGFLPDAYEAGTQNVVGLAGLAAGVRFVLDAGVDRIWQHERTLVSRFVERAAGIPGLVVHGLSSASNRCGVVSFTLERMSPSEVGQLLEDSFGILARVGLHCAPAAHRTIGTSPDGTVRFSFGWYNTEDEVDAAAEAVRAIAAWSRSTVAAR